MDYTVIVQNLTLCLPEKEPPRWKFILPVDQLLYEKKIVFKECFFLPNVIDFDSRCHGFQFSSHQSEF